MIRRKSLTLAAILSFSSTAVVLSGPVMEPAPPPPSPPPMSPPVDLWSWFIGGGAGYLWDAEEEYYYGQLGVEYGAMQSYSHKFFVEVGYAEDLEGDDGSGSFLLTPGNYDGDPETIENDAVFHFDGSLEVVPLTFNYQFEGAFTDSLRWYIGAGAGVGFIDLEWDTEIRGDEHQLYSRHSESDDDTVFVGQVFAGLIWEITENFEIYGGARYIYVDDPEFDDFFDGDVGDDEDIELDDGLVELGFRFSF